MDTFADITIAVVLPCYDEEAAIGAVLADCKRFLPGAVVYVYDNNSTDKTVEVARAHGAIVRFETRQGKGNVVRRAFADIEADIYVLVDGDDTYSLADAPGMVRTLLDGRYDYVNGARLTKAEKAYRAGHKFGNRLFSAIVSFVFGSSVKDMLSGYKVLSRRFVKTFPVMSRGFEIETELLVHALRLHMPIAEVPTVYQERPEGSVSKLSTYKDGSKILLTIVKLIETERPLLFWSCVSGLFAALAIILGIPIVITYFEIGLVPRFPTAFLCGFLGLASLFSLFSGIMLDLVQQNRVEVKRLHYLSIPFVERR
jgi:glycosyltransferase involved in cell wall biosynthesis